jgi:hypothetical protein
MYRGVIGRLYGRLNERDEGRCMMVIGCVVRETREMYDGYWLCCREDQS